jgi:hypothetical protein
MLRQVERFANEPLSISTAEEKEMGKQEEDH